MASDMWIVAVLAPPYVSGSPRTWRAPAVLMWVPASSAEQPVIFDDASRKRHCTAVVELHDGAAATLAALSFRPPSLQHATAHEEPLALPLSLLATAPSSIRVVTDEHEAVDFNQQVANLHLRSGAMCVATPSSDAHDADDATSLPPRRHRLLPSVQARTWPLISSQDSSIRVALVALVEGEAQPLLDPHVVVRALAKCSAIVHYDHCCGEGAAAGVAMSTRFRSYCAQLDATEALIADEVALRRLGSNATLGTLLQPVAAPVGAVEYVSPLFWLHDDNDRGDANSAAAVDLVVGLGGDCACASALRFAALRGLSQPFDWIRTTPQGIEKLLRGCLAPSPTTTGDGRSTHEAVAMMFSDGSTRSVEHLSRDSNEYVAVDAAAAGAKELFAFDVTFGFLSPWSEVESARRRWDRLRRWMKSGVWVNTDAATEMAEAPRRVLLVHVARTVPQAVVVADEVSLGGRLSSSFAGESGPSLAADYEEPVPTLQWTARRWASLKRLRRLVVDILTTSAWGSIRSDVSASARSLCVELVAFNLWPFPCAEDGVRNVVVGFGGEEEASWQTTATSVARWLEANVTMARH